MGKVFSVADPVTGRAGLGLETPDGMLYVVSEPAAADLSGLAGLEPGESEPDQLGTIMFAPGTWFAVTRVSDEGGRRVIYLSHREGPPSHPE
jgi:hypothetical protein